jgi:hypothetical protein
MSQSRLPRCGSVLFGWWLVAQNLEDSKMPLAI